MNKGLRNGFTHPHPGEPGPQQLACRLERGSWPGSLTSDQLMLQRRSLVALTGTQG